MTRILIIDDSRTLRRILASFLREVDCETVEAGDGLEALEQLEKSGPIQLALVDWDMPRMNGLEFVIAVRAKPEYKDLKLMMVTAQTSMDKMVEALASGADDYLMKPLTKEMLFDKLRLLGVLP